MNRAEFGEFGIQKIWDLNQKNAPGFSAMMMIRPKFPGGFKNGFGQALEIKNDDERS